MPYIIDGHNLIPQLGLDLSSIDDEESLIGVILEYSRQARLGQVEIYFDNGQPGQAERQKRGTLTIVFTRRPMIADQAISNRLFMLKKDAKNWTVVSSDRKVQAEAKSAGARVISSDQFSGMVMNQLAKSKPGKTHEHGKLSEAEVEKWLHIFEQSEQKNKNSY
ncbi:MAG: NYN domain-containing protein [Chloroflexota bacterium]